MKHINKRISKIVDELLTYFLNIGGTNIDVSFEEKEDHYLLHFRSNYNAIHKKKIDKLIKFINCPKSEAMEEYYWELTGESDVGTEISLVGMMCDTKLVDITEDTIEIHLVRHK